MKKPLRPLFLIACLMIGLSFLWNGLFPRFTPASCYQEGDRCRIIGRIQKLTPVTRGYRITLDQLCMTSQEAEVILRSEGYISKSDKTRTFRSEEPISFDQNVRVFAYVDELEDLYCGDWVEVSGTVSYGKQAGNPGQFDPVQWMKEQGVCFELRRAVCLRSAQTNSRQGLLDRFRRGVSQCLSRVMTSEDTALISAMMLGDRSGVDEETKELYQSGGISHVMAVSGLHVSLIGMAAYRLAMWLGAGFGLSAGLGSYLIWLFGLMTGMGLSTQRAMVMFIFWCGAQVLGRSPDIPTVLAVSTAITAMRNPDALSSSAFWLSYGCVFSITFIHPILQEGIKAQERRRQLRARKRFKTLHRWKVIALQQIAPSVAVMLGTLPITAWFFYQIAPWSVLVNLVVVPSMSFLMFSAAAAALLGMVSLPLGIFTGSVSHYILKVFKILCQLEAKLPFGVVVTGRPPLWSIALYYLCLVAFLYVIRAKRIAGWKRKAPALVLAGAVLLVCNRIPPVYRVLCMDVGQGDGLLIQIGTETVLIDGGSSQVDQVWKDRIQPCLKYYGIREVDTWFVTHGDSDHISGVKQMLESYEQNLCGAGAGGITVRSLGVSDVTLQTDEKLQDLAVLAQRTGLSLTRLQEGDTLCFSMGMLPGLWRDTATLTCLYPFDLNGNAGETTDPNITDMDEAEDLRIVSGIGRMERKGTNAAGSREYDWTNGMGSNELSLVLQLSIGNDVSMLLTGDLEGAGEALLVSKLEPGTSDLTILKAGHHGSKQATSDELLARLHPDQVWISCGERNAYGHPAGEVLERIEVAGARIFRTDTMGAIELSSRRLFG